MNQSPAAEESALTEVLVAEQGHPGPGRELNFVSVGDTLIENGATVEGGIGEYLHNL